MLGCRQSRMTGWLVASALLIVSCAQDEWMDGRHADRNVIAFGIAEAGADGNAPNTRALPSDDTPVMLLAKGNSDTLYLHPSVEQNLAVPSAKQVTTKGVPINTQNFREQCKSFGVSAYTQQDNKLFMANVEVGQYANGIWKPNGNTRYWPNDDEAVLEFYAHAPYNADLETLAPNDASLTFSYTTPTSSADEKKDAEAQPDIMFAYRACSRSTTNEKGAVPLNFEHALAGVKFVANDIAGSTIKTITLKNLYGEGTCTYTAPAEEAEDGTFTWETSGEKKSFCQTFDVVVNDSQGESKQPITDKKPETTFMMIPQSLDGVEVEIVLKTNSGEQETLSGSLSAPDNQWEAGKIYTYAISSESINWTYVFDVTEWIEFAHGELSKKYEVTSYRYRTQSPEVKQPLKWTAQCVECKETDLQDGAVKDILSNDIVTKFTDNGEGTISGKTYDIGLDRTKMHTTWDGDEKLQMATPKGCDERPYDLSLAYGQQMNTANCYVVDAPGTYQLPLVYGNAIKNGANNTSAYVNRNVFKDYQDKTISSPYIYDKYNPEDCILVWSDGFYMFENVHLSENGKFLVFSLNSEFMQQANAVVAVRDDQGRIMWSWHIWVTERDLYQTIHQLQDYDTGDLNKFGLMQCNLGWVDGKTVYYNQRDLRFNFTQEKSGTVKQMTVKQNGAEYDYKDVGSTYYQWGRKDPLVALRNWDAVGFKDCRPHETIDKKYEYTYQQKQVSLGEAIQNPNVFYTKVNNVNWLNVNEPALWNATGNTNKDALTSTKSIYDPSPVGFKVPIPRAFKVLVNGNEGSGGGSLNGDVVNNNGNYNQYSVFPQKNRLGTPIPMTATGQRADRSGLETYDGGSANAEIGGLWAMYGVYYWTCIHERDDIAYSLVIRKDHNTGFECYTIGFDGSKTMARPVRCIVDR